MPPPTSRRATLAPVVGSARSSPGTSTTRRPSTPPPRVEPRHRQLRSVQHVQARRRFRPRHRAGHADPNGTRRGRGRREAPTCRVAADAMIEAASSAQRRIGRPYTNAWRGNRRSAGRAAPIAQSRVIWVRDVRTRADRRPGRRGSRLDRGRTRDRLAARAAIAGRQLARGSPAPADRGARGDRAGVARRVAATPGGGPPRSTARSGSRARRCSPFPGSSQQCSACCCCSARPGRSRAIGCRAGSRVAR